MAEADPPGKAPVRLDVLGLPEDAHAPEVFRASASLHAHLDARLRETEDDEERARLQLEIEQLFGTRPASDATPAPRSLAKTLALALLILIPWLGLAGLQLTGRLDLTPTPPRPGQLSVSATADGAVLVVEALVDREVAVSGPADGAAHALEPGDYLLRVSREDCPNTWTQQIRIEADDTKRFEATLCEGTGTVIVRSNVSEDRLRVDDLDVGSTGPAELSLAVGDHQVRVDKKGFEPWSGTVRARPDEAVTLQAELTPLASAKTSKPRPKPKAAAEQQAAAAKQQAAAARQQAAAAAAAASSAQQAGGGGTARAGARDGFPLPDGAGTRHDAERQPIGGSKTWHDRIASQLVADHDLDRSGSIDTPAEVDSITCEEWTDIERSYEAGGLGVSMSRLYGFDGSTWRSGALGFSRSVRLHAHYRMKSCGLRS